MHTSLRPWHLLPQYPNSTVHVTSVQHSTNTLHCTHAAVRASSATTNARPHLPTLHLQQRNCCIYTSLHCESQEALCHQPAKQVKVPLLKRHLIYRIKTERIFWEMSDRESSRAQIYLAAAVATTVSQIDGGKERMEAEKDMWLNELYPHVKTKGDVTNPDLWEKVMANASEGDTSPADVYSYSITNGVEKSSHVVAEVSRVSHGVGMELGVAIAKGIPVLCLYRHENFNDPVYSADKLDSADKLSRMVKGAPVQLVEYKTMEDAKAAIDRLFDV